MIDLHPPADNRAQPELDGSYEVVVIGGGPAGATVGALAAEHGHGVLILERSSVPRFHLGQGSGLGSQEPLQRRSLASGDHA